MVYLASTSCEEPLVYFDCATASPGATGVECQKTCGNIDMPPCVSNTHTATYRTYKTQSLFGSCPLFYP